MPLSERRLPRKEYLLGNFFCVRLRFADGGGRVRALGEQQSAAWGRRRTADIARQCRNILENHRGVFAVGALDPTESVIFGGSDFSY